MQTINFVNCESCLVYGTNNKPLSDARVIKTHSSLTLILSNPKLREVTVTVPVDFRDYIKGIVRCMCKLHIRKNMQVGNSNEVWAADCVVLKIVEVIQRHKDLRVPVEINALCGAANDTMFRIRMINISAHGMKFATSRVMSNGTVFNLEYTFSGRLCKLKAQVLYGRFINHECVYGCAFQNMSVEDERAIRQFVFSKEESLGIKERKAV